MLKKNFPLRINNVEGYKDKINSELNMKFWYNYPEYVFKLLLLVLIDILLFITKLVLCIYHVIFI